ncbi:MAG: outer membrane beta-barrel protein [Thiolinea sp.]
MKHLMRAGLILSGLMCLSSAHAGGEYLQGWGFANDTRFYAGGSLGAANQNDFDDGSSSAGKLFGGVRYRQIGAEVGYAKLGEVETVSTSGRLDSNLKSDTGGLYAAAVGYMPVYYRTELIGKLGAMYWDQENSEQTDLIDEQGSSSDSGLSPLLGIGAQYQLSQNLHLRGEWEHVFAAGEDGRNGCRYAERRR